VRIILFRNEDASQKTHHKTEERRVKIQGQRKSEMRMAVGGTECFPKIASAD